MSWYTIDTWIVVIGALAATSCALLGNFLVLRKMSMMGDAISHAVLPGLALAFLFTSERTSLIMFIGAAFVGVITATFTQWISRFGKVDEGASMGIVFTSLFAIGLLLIVQAADHVDLDPSCVLYGAIELAPLDVIWQPTLFGFTLHVPRAVLVLGAIVVLNLGFLLSFFKELRISSFDPDLATTMGINSNLIHYLLMSLVAVTTVAAFEVVGSIIVIAMLIVPAATALLLTDRLWVMVALSVVFANAAALFGHLSALIVPSWFGFDDTSTSGTVAVVSGLLFVLIMFVAPRHGLLCKWLHNKSL